LDISNNQNIRITFGAGSNGLTFTVRISSAASGQNSDVALVFDTVALAANAMSSRIYPSPVARILRVNVRITSRDNAFGSEVHHNGKLSQGRRSGRWKQKITASHTRQV